MKKAFISIPSVIALAFTLAVFTPKPAHANVWDDFVDWVKDVHAQHEAFWVDVSESYNTCQTTVVYACHGDIRDSVLNGDGAKLYLPFALPRGSNGKDELAYEWLQNRLVEKADKPTETVVINRFLKEFFPDGHPDRLKRPLTQAQLRAIAERERRAREEAERRAHNFNLDSSSRLGDSRFPFSQTVAPTRGSTQSPTVAQQTHDPAAAVEPPRVAYSHSFVGVVRSPGCNELSTPGTYLCSGAAGTTQRLDAGPGETLVVIDESTFSIHTDSGHAIVLRGAPGSGGIGANFASGITAEKRGIDVDNQGSGNTAIVTDAVASKRGIGIRVKTGGASGDASVVANGALEARGAAVHVRHAGYGTLSIDAGDAVVASRGPGIRAHLAATNLAGVDINAEGGITARYRGIFVENAGSGDTAIDAAGIESGHDGIHVANAGAGDVRIITADIVSGGTGVHVPESGGAVSIAATGLIDAIETGIRINHEGPGRVSVTSTGGIRSDGEFAVDAASAYHASAVPAGSGMRITVAGDIGASDDPVGKGGIRADHSNRGDLAITAGRVFANWFGIVADMGVNSGAATIAANGRILAGGAGIRANHDGAGKLSIHAGDAVSATGGAGIAGHLGAANTGGIEVRADGEVTSRRRMGVSVNNAGTGDIDITVADIRSRLAGIFVHNASSGNTTITANGDVSGGIGIRVNDGGGTGDIVVALGAAVAGTSGTAVELNGGARQKLVLNTGASFSGRLVSSRSDAILELAAGTGGNDSFDLGSLREGSNFVDFDKTGDGTWELAGIQASGSNEFASADVEAGTLRFHAATLRLSAGGSLTIAPGARLEVNGASILHGDLVNSGALALGSTGETGSARDRLTVTGGYTTGGSLTLDVDFAGGGADQLRIEGGVSGTSATEVNLRAGSGIYDAGAVTVPAAVLIDVAGAGVGDDGDFTAGRIYDGVTMHDFTLERSSSDGDWRIATIGEQTSPAPNHAAPGPVASLSPAVQAERTEGSFPDRDGQLGALSLTASDRNGTGTTMPSVPTYESYAATILELSRLSALHDRIDSRVWIGEEGRGLWAGVNADNLPGSGIVAGLSDSFRSEFKPSGTMGANSYEVDDVRTRFGIEHPVLEDLSLGASLWFNRARANVSSAVGDGDITVNGYGLAATASWLSDAGLYADGQVQYAAFTSDLSVADRMQVSGNDAFSLSASGEVGYRISLGDTTLISRGRLMWSDVQFDDFLDPTGARISLRDGDALTGVLGVSASREWNGEGSQGSIHGNADLHLPLDGETGASVAGVHLSSRLQEPVIDLGIGASYSWDGLHSLYGEIATAQGADTEDYRASIGIRFGF